MDIDCDAVMNSIITRKDWIVLKEAIIKLASDELRLVYTRNVFFASFLKNLDKILNNDMLELGEFIVKNLPNQNFFEKELFKIKSELANVYDAKEEYYLAAKILSEINYESANI
jgi:hypothetical protein